MNRVIGRSAILMILVIALTVGCVLFTGEFLLCSKDWVMTEGSPHIYTDYSAVCGTVTDRNGFVLLDTQNGRVYSQNLLVNRSVIHWLGDRDGFIYAPTIAYYAKKMTKFDPINGLYAYGNDKGVVELTLSAKVQAAALEALGERKGVVAVYNYQTGELLCAVSNPSYDPDDVPDISSDTDGTWDGVYLNRFLKAVYPPGSIFKIVTLAAALEAIPDVEEQIFHCAGETAYGIDKVTCLKEHGDLNLEAAFLNSCNCAFAAIADQLGGETLQQYADMLGVGATFSFDGVSSVAGSIQSKTEAPVMVAWSAIGQHKDLVNPCQFLNLMGAIAGGGSAGSMHFVSSITGGGWGDYVAPEQKTEPILSAETAALLVKYMRNNVENYYGDENFEGLTVCAKSGTAELGADLEPNSMFSGFVTDEEYPLAFIVVVENGGSGRKTCVPILSEVLAACKEVFDQE